MALRFTVQEQFELPPEQVFEVMTDTSRAAAWMPGFVSIEKLTDGAFGEGTRWRETRKMFGRVASEEFEVVRCVPPTTLELFVDGKKGSSGRGEYRFVYELAPLDEDGGTRVTLSGEIGGIGKLMQLMGRLFMSSFKKACARDLQAMRDYLRTCYKAPEV